MDNYIVAIKNVNEWKKVLTRAFDLGLTWPADYSRWGKGIGTQLFFTPKEMYSDDSQVVIIINGTKNLHTEDREPLTVNWGTDLSVISDFSHYTRVSADTFLSLYEGTEKRWVVTFYPEDHGVPNRGLTQEQALKKVRECPEGYITTMTPMPD